VIGQHYPAATWAAKLGVSVDTIERAVLNGELESFRPAGKGHRLIPETSVRNWLVREDVEAWGRVVSLGRVTSRARGRA
jgi:excisionase family DNA binding protein